MTLVHHYSNNKTQLQNPTSKIQHKSDTASANGISIEAKEPRKNYIGIIVQYIICNTYVIMYELT